jgi:hypothetical protein
VFLGAACYPDVAFHSPTEGRDASSSCYATSLSVTTCKLKYDINFVTSAYFNKHGNMCYSKRRNFYVIVKVWMCLARLLLCEFV